MHTLTNMCACVNQWEEPPSYKVLGFSDATLRGGAYATLDFSSHATCDWLVKIYNQPLSIYSYVYMVCKRQYFLCVGNAHLEYFKFVITMDYLDVESIEIHISISHFSRY